MRRLCAQLTLALMVIPVVVHGDNFRQAFIDTTQVQSALDKANQIAGTISVSPNNV